MSKFERCYNCIHCNPCSAKGGLTQDGQICNHFKDKSLCVELPVKVGQVVYRIISYGNSRNQIIGHEIEANQVIEVYYREEIENKEFGKNIEFTFNTTYADEYTKSDIGELVYLTKEEAEAKLKEIEGK